MSEMTEMRSPLRRVRGLGPTKDGLGHWWAQRMTSVALVPLTAWFVLNIPVFVGADLAAFQAWVSVPGNTVLLVLLVIAMFAHAVQGVQVIFEDYVHTEWVKVGGLVVVKGLAWFFAAASILAVLKVAFGS